MKNAPANTTGNDPPPSRPLLWTATRPGAPPVAFFGVLHFGVPDMYPLPPSVENAYDAADMAAFETDLRQVSSPAFAASIQARGVLPPDESLPNKLSASTWQRLLTAAASLGNSSPLLSTLTPWYCSSTLTSAALRRNGLASALGLDTYLFSRATAENKAIHCLETPEQQLALLASISAESDETLILNLLDELEAMPEFSRHLLTLWRQGDAAPLARLISRSFTNHPDQQERMLKNRNDAWFSQLERLNNHGHRIFVAVGAGHLVGRGSLISLFRRRHFKVVQAE